MPFRTAMFIVLSMCCDAHTRVSLPERSALDRSATESWSFRCFRRSAFVMRGCRDALCVGLCCLWAYNMVMLLCMLVTARRSRSVGTARASRGDIRVSSLRRGSASRSRHSRHSRYASFRRWTGRDSVSSARGADSAASRVANLGGVFSHDVTNLTRREPTSTFEDWMVSTGSSKRRNAGFSRRPRARRRREDRSGEMRGDSTRARMTSTRDDVGFRVSSTRVSSREASSTLPTIRVLH